MSYTWLRSAWQKQWSIDRYQRISFGILFATMACVLPFYYLLFPFLLFAISNGEQDKDTTKTQTKEKREEKK